MNKKPRREISPHCCRAYEDFRRRTNNPTSSIPGRINGKSERSGMNGVELNGVR